MKECKCGKIPPCYGGKIFSMHEELGKIKPCSEETAQGVIEALRNASELNEASNRLAERIFEDILKSIKSNDMEKKTNKMTKVEAFEYLKGKKVKCYKVGEHYGEKLLKKLTECGCTSNIFLPKGILSVWAIFISDACDLSILDTAHADQYGNYDLFEIAADDILSIEIVDEKKVLSVDCALEHAKWIMKYLREECSPHTKMIIEGDHAELVEGVKSVVWKEDM